MARSKHAIASSCRQRNRAPASGSASQRAASGGRSSRRQAAGRRQREAGQAGATVVVCARGGSQKPKSSPGRTMSARAHWRRSPPGGSRRARTRSPRTSPAAVWQAGAPAAPGPAPPRAARKALIMNCPCAAALAVDLCGGWSTTSLSLLLCWCSAPVGETAGSPAVTGRSARLPLRIAANIQRDR